MKNESGCTDTVTAARQGEYMQPLPAVQGVKQNGKTFYADPYSIHHQVYTGYRVQYQAYKQAQLLASRQNPALNVHPDPHGVVVNEFDGWVPGPLAPIDGD
jgi:hypothetical protein